LSFRKQGAEEDPRIGDDNYGYEYCEYINNNDEDDPELNCTWYFYDWVPPIGFYTGQFFSGQRLFSSDGGSILTSNAILTSKANYAAVKNEIPDFFSDSAINDAQFIDTDLYKVSDHTSALLRNRSAWRDLDTSYNTDPPNILNDTYLAHYGLYTVRAKARSTSERSVSAIVMERNSVLVDFQPTAIAKFIIGANSTNTTQLVVQKLSDSPDGEAPAARIVTSGNNKCLLIDPTTTRGNNTRRYVDLLPVDLATDINNDGQLTSADSGITGKPYASGASEDEKDKGTEFMFLNDDLSNGAWDRNDSKTPSDGKPADPNDDDAEEIVIKFQASQGEIWLDHPAINSLKFYDNAKCTGTEVPLKSGNRLHLGSRAIPEHVFMRVDTEVSGHQSAGDLVLKYVPTSGGTAIDATKMRLVLVDDIRAEKHHRAVVDYIREKNTKHYVAWADSVKESAYVGYLGKETLLDGVDPRHRFNDVRDALTLDADAIVNGNYAGDRTGTTGCASWPDWQDGEIYESGTWNSATSHLAGPARQEYWRTTIDSNIAKFIHTNGTGAVPAASTRGGIGGLVTVQVNGDLGVCAMGRAELQGGDQLVYVADIRRNVDLTSFKEGMSAGSTSSFFGELDGGGSTCMAIGSPSGKLFFPIAPSSRHTNFWRLYFRTRNDLVGGYLRLQTTRGRVDP
jgi:hypothetical protein